MIVLYTQFNKKLHYSKWIEYLSIVPGEVQNRINRYRKWQDKQATLFGRLLLKEGLTQLGYSVDCLDNIKLDRYNRPYIDKKIDFNISHSGNYVVCVLEKKARIGIDIEKINKIDLSYYKEYLYPKYWREIQAAKEKYKTFYKYWTKIESIVKADGRGLTIQTKKIVIKNNRTILDGNRWFTNKLNINEDYVCHVTTNLENLPIKMSEVVF